MSNKAITFTNDDGTFKSKEQFLSEAAEVYDNVAEALEEEDRVNIFEVCTSPESQIDVAATMSTFNILTKSIEINEEISPELANKVVKLIRFYNEADKQLDHVIPIVIYINTDGGELFAALSIVAAIESSTTPIYTVNMGKAFSAGFLILIAGHKRFGMRYSSYLFHEGSNCIIGDAHKTIQSADFYKKNLQQIKEIILDNTKIGEELYSSHEKDDWWFSVDEAYELGVIDEIVYNFEDITAIEECNCEDCECEEDEADESDTCE